MRFGIELTFIRWKNKDKLDKFLGRHYPKAYYDGAGGLFWHTADWSQKALEFPSPIFRTTKQFSRWYDKLDDTVIKPFGLKTHYYSRRENTIYGTGGGHVHCEIPEITPLMVASFLQANKGLYYLNWIFGDVCEEWIRRYERCEPENFINKCPSSTITLSQHKTLEHRYFDAPKNKQEAIDFIEFGRALTERISLGLIPGVFKMFDYKQCADENHVAACFNELLSFLSLDNARYKPYFKRYLNWKNNYKLI